MRSVLLRAREIFQSAFELIVMKLNLLLALTLLSGVYGAVKKTEKAALRGVRSSTSAKPKDTPLSEAPACGTLEMPQDFLQRAERGMIFNMLSEVEINDVVQWMLMSSGLNLKPYDEADLYSDNYITYVYLADPNKQEALNYLETGTNMPMRKAHVHVSMAGLATPCMRQYVVGPLPIGPTTTISAPLSFGGVTDVPFDARHTSSKEYDHIDELVLGVMGEIDTEMRDSYGTNYYSECLDEFCLTYSDTSPRGPKRDITLWFVFAVEAFFANPIGLYLTFRMGEQDTTQHALKLIVYNGQSFDSVQQFKTAYAAGTLIKLANRPLNQVLMSNEYGVDWASLKKAPTPTGVNSRRGAVTRLNSNIAAPQVHEPGGKRFLVQDGHVDYLGWAFNIAHSPLAGVKLFNIRYRDESVAYEIGLSEALAVYSGIQDLVQAATVYGDTAWGLGASAREMVRGVDCPSTGILTSITYLLDSGEASTTANTICIFEQAADTPLRRHSGDTGYGGLAMHYLVVRIILPVYNYDYVLDHIFHLNGAIELRGSTSGYLQSTFYSPQMKDETNMFGQRIGPFTAGTTHDHVLNFKIDMDVKGTTNSLVRTTTRAVKATPKDIHGKPYMLSNFEVANDYTTKVLDTDTIQRESGFVMSGSKPMMYQVVANKGFNRWRNRRQGYRLKLNGIVENVVAHTKSLRAYSFSKYTFAATVRHEDEPTVSSIYDQSDTTGTIMMNVTGGVARPHVDLDRFLNGEDLDQADLVLWVNVGVHHHTHSEDIPVTTTNGNTVNIWLLPHNMHDFDDSLDLGNALYAGEDQVMNYYDLKQGPSDLCPLVYDVPGAGYPAASAP